MLYILCKQIPELNHLKLSIFSHDEEESEFHILSLKSIMLKYFRTEGIFIFDKITEKIQELIKKTEDELQICFYC